MAREPGEWDHFLYGGFTTSSLRKDGVFYLYHQGASGYRTLPDETVIWRAIGVATSQDGINFTKSDKNPIITWCPNRNGEEGAVSAGITINKNRGIILYYGANTEESPSLVNSDVRAAISSDGINFTDTGPVIWHKDPHIWGSGDEIFPILSIYDRDCWFLYYLPNGVIGSGLIGVTWGDEFDHFTKSKRSGLFPIKGWGTGSYAEIGPDKYVMFINNVGEGNG